MTWGVCCVSLHVPVYPYPYAHKQSQPGGGGLSNATELVSLLREMTFWKEGEYFVPGRGLFFPL